MTQEEKAKEIYKDNLYDCEVRGVVQDKQEILFMLEKMAKWKEEQLIKKACEWLEYNFNMPSDFKEHFIKAMTEE